MIDLEEIYISEEEQERLRRAEVNSTSLDSRCEKTGREHVSSGMGVISLGVVKDICKECGLGYNRRATAKEVREYLEGINTFA